MEADNAEDNCTNAVDTEIDDTEETQPDDGKDTCHRFSSEV